MARKAAKAKSRAKSKKAGGKSKASRRKAKVAGKRKTPRKTAKRKTAATPKKAPPKKAPPPAPTPAAKKPAPEARALKKAPAKPAADAAARNTDAELRLNRAVLVEDGAAAPKPAALADDEAKTLAVARVVDDLFAEEKKKINDEELKDADKLSIFHLGNIGLDGMLGKIRGKLQENKPPFKLTITPELKEKCHSADETIGKLKSDINKATTKAAPKPAPIAAELAGAAPAALRDAGEAKVLAVARAVDDLFAEEKKKRNDEELKDADKLSTFRLGDNGLDGMLGKIRGKLQANQPPFTLTITPELKEKCHDGDETIGKLKSDINNATTRS
jgi:hypothetical protein